MHTNTDTTNQALMLPYQAQNEKELYEFGDMILPFMRYVYKRIYSTSQH